MSAERDDTGRRGNAAGAAGTPTGGAANGGTAQPILRAERITKRFGGVVALRDVSFDVVAGSVTCLLGDNGAGKSTLIKVISGVFPPTDGRLLLDGAEVRFSAPRDALAAGIATVFQDLALVPLLSVWRNFHLGAEPTVGRGPLRRIDVRAARRSTLDALGEFGIHLTDAERAVGTLSGGERQSIAIARAVHRGARVLILDEPTAALGQKQTALVLDTISRVRELGIGVVLITHDARQADAVADRRVVLEKGAVVT
jgi:simple sugar transport system ATP-binding protein